MGEIILWVYSVIGASAVLVLTAWGVTELLDRLRRPSFDQRIFDVERNVRNSIGSDARWFSEDPPTMAAIEGLAKGRQVDEVREIWRRARAAQKSHSRNCTLPNDDFPG